MHMQTLFFFPVFNNGSRQLDGKMTVWLLILDKVIAPSFFIPLAPDNADLRLFPSYLAVVLNYHKLTLCPTGPEQRGECTFHLDVRETVRHTQVIRNLESRNLRAVMSHALSMFCSAVPCFVASPAHRYVSTCTAHLQFQNSQSPRVGKKKNPQKQTGRKWIQFNASKKDSLWK